MPEYADMNALGADLPMPALMWDADTEMNCVRESVGQLIEHAYAHHIQRLMVLGLFSMLLGVRPYDVHRWHLSMYIDAIDWVSLPNVLGMSRHEPVRRRRRRRLEALLCVRELHQPNERLLQGLPLRAR
jgi:deoxyribodipyrimidine photolyase-related protein